MNQTLRNMLLLFPVGKQAYLAYDSLTRANADALGYTERKGPLGLARLRLPWVAIGGDLDIVGGAVTGGTAQTTIVSNGNMETDDPPIGWAIENNAVPDGVADERTGGAGVQSIDLAMGVGKTQARGRQSIGGLTGGTLMVLRGWLRNVDGDDVQMNVLDAAYGTIFTTAAVAGVAWTQQVYVFALRDASARLGLIVNSTLGDGTSGRFDDVSLIECHAEYIAPAEADVIYRAELTTPAAGTSPAGLILRRDGATQWLVQMTPGTAGTDFELIELNDGTPTQRASADRDFAINTTYRIAVALTGQSIIVYQDGVQRLAYAIAAVGLTNTQFGIWDSANANFSFDNVEITQYARYNHAGGY